MGIMGVNGAGYNGGRINGSQMWRDTGGRKEEFEHCRRILKIIYCLHNNWNGYFK